ncbi:hypothetical protein CLIB1444_17S00892 [[Candida] jaroonii]|uniref:Uncharacterized protein n=1 Tax=[Candida] jaroonii TaxID=467808 RepID=A0ACA9YG72_9ASCO|nr:hypothetical protein CLIB1444_17S00892 [[Candida] jaroonii]
MDKAEILKRQILGADNLTIREGLFLPNEEGKFARLPFKDYKLLQEVIEELEWKATYRVYFSLPHRVSFIEDKVIVLEYAYLFDIRDAFRIGDSSNSFPKGSENPADHFLRDIIPRWTRRFKNDWLDSKFCQLDKKLGSIWSELGTYTENDDKDTTTELYKLYEKVYDLPSRFPGEIEITKGCEKFTVAEEFHTEVSSILGRYFAALGLNVTASGTHFSLGGSHFKEKPSVLFREGGENIPFFIEFKRNGLIDYVDENGLKDKKEINSIMKQVSKYMLATGSDCGIITDLEVSILIQLDFETTSGSTEKIIQEDGKATTVAILPFQYYVFHPNDTIYTLQAIICSVAYDQKLRAEDPIQKENVERLRALIVQEDSELQIPKCDGRSKFRRGSGIQTSHLTSSSTISLNPSSSMGEKNNNPQTNGQKSWSQYKQSKFILNEGDFEVLQPGGYYLSTVYKLNRAAIDKNLSHLNIPQSVSHVIMKVYDLYKANFFTEYNEWKINYSGLKIYMGEKFSTEVECNIRINTYNEFRSQEDYLRVPKMYEFGGGFVRDGDRMLSFGWYLISEFIEKDEDQRFSLEEAKKQVNLLGSLGIQHNDIYRRNVLVSNGKFNLIDFSEASFDEIDLRRDLNNLEHVWSRNMDQAQSEDGPSSE